MKTTDGTEKRLEGLTAAYENLTSFEKTLVQLCSVILEPVNKTKILKCFHRTGIRIPGIKISRVSELSPYLNRLRDLGLLDEDFCCNELFVEKATRRAMASGLKNGLQETNAVNRFGAFPAMARAVQRELPPPAFNGHDNPFKSRLRLFRDFRVGIYTHDDALWNECYNRYCSISDASDSDRDPFVRICMNPFDSEWFSSLPLPTRITAMMKIFQSSLSRLESDREVLALALDEDFRCIIPENERPGFYTILLSRLLFAGRVKEVRRLIPEIADNGYTGGLAAWSHFIQGANDQAIDAFETDLSTLREKTGNHDLYFVGMAGLFFILALLKRQVIHDDDDALETLTLIIDSALARRYPHPMMEPSYRALNAILQYCRYEKETAEKTISENSVGREPVADLFTVLAKFWIFGRVDREEIDLISTIFMNARKIGLDWMAMEAAELLCRVEQQIPIRKNFADRVKRTAGLTSMMEMLRVEAPWQKTLHALVRAVAPRPRKTGEGPGKRLIWLVSFKDDQMYVQPREQNLTVRSTWTKGHAVALSRLFSGRDLEYLSHQDRMIQASLEKFSSYVGQVEHRFNPDKMLPALIGHPHLFLEDSPSEPVEVVRGDPEIIVEPLENIISIRLNPCVPPISVNVIRETRTRFKVVELSREQRRIAAILAPGGIDVPAYAEDEALSAISALSGAVTVHSAIGGGKGISRVEADSTPHVHLTRAGDGVRMELFVKPFGSDGPYLAPGAGRENIFAVIKGKQVMAKRDLGVERQKTRIFEGVFPDLDAMEQAGAGFLIMNPRACLNALIDLKELQERNAVVVEWPKGEKLEVTRAIPLDRLQLAIREKTDWFEISGGVKLDDDLVVEMKTLLDWVGNSPGRFVPISEGKFLTLTRSFRERLEEIAACCRRDGDAIELHPGAALILENLAEEVETLDADESWTRRVKRIQDGWCITPSVPSTLKAELRHYQEEGVHWLSRLAYWGFGACLADDMGLGKTLQALSVILDRAPEGPSLVVAPTSVCLNWMAELNRFAPTLNPIYFTGRNREAIVKALKPYDVLVVSYGLMQVESDLLSAVTFETAVLDEAQAIKNYATKRSRAAMNLKGKFKIITTGTPIENHLGELYALFEFINPGLLGSRNRFNERFVVPIEKDNDHDARQRLKNLIQPFILRRLKTEVLEELPPRTEIVLQVEMEEDEAALYEALRQTALERLEETENMESRRFKILAEIMKLRRACCNPRLVNPDADMPGAKLTVFGNVVAELLENRHKALVFSQFVGHLEIIREFLDEKNIDYKYLDGSTPAKERQRQVDDFQAGEGDLFLISLKAGGLGLNLTAASYVIHMDPWWNPAVEDQASDRAHRIGQKHPVTVYRLVTHNTIEEKILGLHKKKRDLADSLLTGSDMTGKMTAKDLFKLIRET